MEGWSSKLDKLILEDLSTNFSFGDGESESLGILLNVLFAWCFGRFLFMSIVRIASRSVFFSVQRCRFVVENVELCIEK